jgi:Raf kinase inhibitor-like YbhB/YbcL family protein
VSAGKSSAQRSATLAAFERAFQQRWKAQTTCKPGYVMEDCAEYRGRPEDLTIKHTASSSSTSGSSTAAAASSSSSTRSSGTSAGELPPSAPGAMTLSSSAFERDGALPAQYTCAGANISPPLQWQNVPAKAAALVLFAIDDTTPGAAGGIRWIVGDIDPTSKGVAAGQTPEGGIVGTNTQGHTGYGGICPPHGKTATIEFVLYALRKKIPLTPGFQPTTAESEYGAGKLLLGSAAVTYATAQGG